MQNHNDEKSPSDNGDIRTLIKRFILWIRKFLILSFKSKYFKLQGFS